MYSAIKEQQPSQDQREYLTIKFNHHQLVFNYKKDPEIVTGNHICCCWPLYEENLKNCEHIRKTCNKRSPVYVVWLIMSSPSSCKSCMRTMRLNIVLINPWKKGRTCLTTAGIDWIYCISMDQYHVDCPVDLGWGSMHFQFTLSGKGEMYLIRLNKIPLKLKITQEKNLSTEEEETGTPQTPVFRTDKGFCLGQI